MEQEIYLEGQILSLGLWDRCLYMQLLNAIIIIIIIKISIIIIFIIAITLFPYLRQAYMIPLDFITIIIIILY